MNFFKERSKPVLYHARNWNEIFPIEAVQGDHFGDLLKKLAGTDSLPPYTNTTEVLQQDYGEKITLTNFEITNRAGSPIKVGLSHTTSDILVSYWNEELGWHHDGFITPIVGYLGHHYNRTHTKYPKFPKEAMFADMDRQRYPDLKQWMANLPTLLHGHLAREVDLKYINGTPLRIGYLVYSSTGLEMQRRLTQEFPQE